MTDRDQRIMEHKIELRLRFKVRGENEGRIAELQRILGGLYGCDLKGEGLV